jgi:hypothetical protein
MNKNETGPWGWEGCGGRRLNGRGRRRGCAGTVSEGPGSLINIIIIVILSYYVCNELGRHSRNALAMAYRFLRLCFRLGFRQSGGGDAV